MAGRQERRGEALRVQQRRVAEGLGDEAEVADLACGRDGGVEGGEEGGGREGPGLQGVPAGAPLGPELDARVGGGGRGGGGGRRGGVAVGGGELLGVLLVELCEDWLGGGWWCFEDWRGLAAAQGVEDGAVLGEEVQAAEDGDGAEELAVAAGEVLDGGGGGPGGGDHV